MIEMWVDADDEMIQMWLKRDGGMIEVLVEGGVI